MDEHSLAFFNFRNIGPNDPSSRREGELLGLRWSDINLEGAKLTVNHSLDPSKLAAAKVSDPEVAA